MLMIQSEEDVDTAATQTEKYMVTGSTTNFAGKDKLGCFFRYFFIKGR